jgi:hypothetical protein
MIISAILLATSIYPQITNYWTAPPLGKTFSEVIRIEKIDTAKVLYSSGVMVVTTKIAGDSVSIMYNFGKDNRLVSKVHTVPTPNMTAKAALKKYRVFNQKIRSVYGQPSYHEGMASVPTTDSEKANLLTEGEPLFSQYETDNFYISVLLMMSDETRSFEVRILYITPEEWAKYYGQ